MQSASKFFFSSLVRSDGRREEGKGLRQTDTNSTKGIGFPLLSLLSPILTFVYSIPSLLEQQVRTFEIHCCQASWKREMVYRLLLFSAFTS